MLNVKDRFFLMLRRLSPFGPQRGQSLVEMTVVVPLLLFMFLGLIEVGWAIRGYLVLLSTNREAVRFAARGEYLNFGGMHDNKPMQQIETDIGYNFVKAHAGEVLLSNRLGLELFDDQGNPLLQPLDDATKGAFMLTHVFVDTKLPCHPNDITGNGAQYNGTCLIDDTGSCNDPANRRPDYPWDDMILIHTMTGYQHFFYQIPYSTTYQSRLDISVDNSNPGPPVYSDPIQELKEENDNLNCEIQRREPEGLNPTFSVNSVLFGEAFYDQPQLLGFPFFQFVGKEVPLYVQTDMRITSDNLPQGAGCELLPIVIHEDTLYTDAPANNTPKGVGTPLINIRDGGGPGGFGWLKWRNTAPEDPEMPNSAENAVYLENAIFNPRYSIYDYINAIDSTDTTLNVNDWVWSGPGQVAASGVIDQIEARENGALVTIPVWKTTAGNGSSLRYQIVDFALMRITNIDFQGNPKYISGDFMGFNTDCYIQN